MLTVSPGCTALQRLPLHTCPSDGVYVTASAAVGARALLGGDDGGLYELSYSTESSWRGRRCGLTRHAPPPLSFLPSPLRRLLASPDAVRQLVADPARGILYSRSAAGAIAVFDLGSAGEATASRVAAIESLLPMLQRGAPATTSASAAATAAAAATPIGMAVVGTSESRDVTLVVVLQDGRRVYFSAYPLIAPLPVAGAPPRRRPSELRLVAVRDAPKANAGGGATAAAAAAAAFQPGAPMTFGVGATPARPLVADAALYAEGLLVLSDASGGERAPRLVAAAAEAASAVAGARGLRETSTTLALREDAPVAAEVGALAEVPPPEEAIAALHPPLPARATAALIAASSRRPGGAAAAAANAAAVAAALPPAPPRGELATQHAMPPRRLVALSGAGTLLLSKPRPVDTLAALLGRAAGRAALESFFAAFGAAEASAMCALLATAPPGGPDGVAQQVAEAARRALEDTRLVGEPHMSDPDALAAAANAAAVVAGQMYAQPGGAGQYGMGGAAMGGNPYGAAVGAGPAPPAAPPAQLGMALGTAVPASELRPSAAHDGLCLHAARLLRPAWKRPLTVGGGDAPGPGGKPVPAPLALTLDATSLAALEGRLRALERFVSARTARSGGLGGGGGGGDHGGGGGEALARTLEALHKRRRLEDAASAERASMRALAALLRRSAEAAALLSLLDCPPRGGALHFGELSLRMDAAARDALQRGATLRTLVAEPGGGALAEAMVEALRRRYAAEKDAAGAEQLAAALGARCPGFFPPERAALFRGDQALDVAHDAPVGSAARTAALATAAAAFAVVPAAVPLPRTAVALCELGAWPLLCDVALHAARAWADAPPLSPASATMAPDEAAAAATAARERAYCCVADALRGLAAARGAADSTRCGEAAAAGCAAGGPPAREAALQALLAAAGARCDGDVAFAERVFAALADVAAALGGDSGARLEEALLGLKCDAGLLEGWLAREGRLGDAARRGGRGGGALPSPPPLTAREARLLELLARSRARRGAFGGAARVCAALGLRPPPPPTEQPLLLPQRRDALELAKLYARSQPLAPPPGTPADPDRLSANEVADLEGYAAVLSFQAELAERAAERGPPPPPGTPAADARAALERQPLELASLYNDYAFPDGFWDIALRIVAFSGVPDAPRCAALWDSVLRDAVARAEGPSAALRAAATAVAETGRAVRGSAAALPLPHLALQLERVAAGLWPRAGPPADGAPVAPALLAAAGDPEAVAGAYHALLQGGAGAASAAPDAATDLQLPLLRGRLLGSLARAVAAWAQQGLAAGGGGGAAMAALGAGGAYGAPPPPAARAAAELRARLAEMCDSCAAEASRLQMPAAERDAVTRAFETLRRDLRAV